MTLHNHHEAATIAELLEDARTRRGISKTKATRMIDTTDLTYRQWTRGQMPGVEWADTLAEFCQVSRYTILAAMGILTVAEAEVLDRELGDDPSTTRIYTRVTAQRLRRAVDSLRYIA